MKLRLAAGFASAILAAGFASAIVAASPARAKSQAVASVTRTPQTVAGFWQQVGDDGHVGGWFFFEQKNGLYEGRLVKMFKQPGEDRLIDTCQSCPGDQKDAPMLGLAIVKGMRRTGNKYEDGSIMDPRDGSIYHAQMEMSPDGQSLAVRGYLGIPLLGQTQIWKRLPDDTMAPADIPPDSHGPASSQAE